MTNDAFVAFWCGCGCGLIVGIMMCAVIIAISNSIEGGNKHD